MFFELSLYQTNSKFIWRRCELDINANEETELLIAPLKRVYPVAGVKGGKCSFQPFLSRINKTAKERQIVYRNQKTAQVIQGSVRSYILSEL